MSEINKTTNNKITKIEMVSAITEHLSSLNKRMTNLKYASISELEEIVKKYGIDINTFVIERKALMKEQRIINKQKKEKINNINNLCGVIDEKLLCNKHSFIMELQSYAIVMRVNQNTINVNGVNKKYKKQNNIKEYYMKYANGAIMHIKRTLFDIGILKELSDLNHYYLKNKK